MNLNTREQSQTTKENIGTDFRWTPLSAASPPPQAQPLLLSAGHPLMGRDCVGRVPPLCPAHDRQEQWWGLDVRWVSFFLRHLLIHK